MDVLDVMRSAPFDDTVTHIEWHTHLPYASMTLNNSDEIRIPIQQQDICVVPSMSYLYVEGKLLLDKNTVPKNTKFTNNAFAYLFDEIRYELNGVEIDRVRNPGIVSTLKGYASFNDNTLKTMTNAGWTASYGTLPSSTVDSQGNFSFAVPLSSLCGFCEDYRKVIINARHELVLIRSSGDKNAVLCELPTATDTVESVKVTLDKLSWRIPYVTLSDEQRIALLKLLSRGASIPVEYRSWELYEYPALPVTGKQSWTVKTTSQLEKPRYVFVAFQTDRKNNLKKNAAHFDHCNLSNLKLHLNSMSYPYDDLKLDFKRNHYALLYDMYSRFQDSYYHTQSQPLMDKQNFKDYAPLIIVDCSKQNESLKSAPVDIRLEFEAAENFPEHTSAYCLIIHDKSFTYSPSTSIVRLLI